jgi:hypothetical protein
MKNKEEILKFKEGLLEKIRASNDLIKRINVKTRFNAEKLAGFKELLWYIHRSRLELEEGKHARKRS